MGKITINQARECTICPKCGHLIGKGELYVKDTDLTDSYCSNCVTPYFDVLSQGNILAYHDICQNWRRMFPCNREGFEHLRNMIFSLAWSVEATLKIALLNREAKDKELKREEIITRYHNLSCHYEVVMNLFNKAGEINGFYDDPEKIAKFLDIVLPAFFDD